MIMLTPLQKSFLFMGVGGPIFTAQITSLCKTCRWHLVFLGLFLVASAQKFPVLVLNGVACLLLKLKHLVFFAQHALFFAPCAWTSQPCYE